MDPLLPNFTSLEKSYDQQRRAIIQQKPLEEDNNNITTDNSKQPDLATSSCGMSESDIVAATLRCVLVGNSGVGKSTLLRSIAGLPPLTEANNTANGTTGCRALAQSVALIVDLPAAKRGKARSSASPVKVRLRLEDTPGSHSMDLLRPRLYADAGAFLLCFSASETSSAEQLVTRWLPELVRHQSGVPILLLAIQSDRQRVHRSVMAKASRAAEIISSTSGMSTSSLLMTCSSTRWQPNGLNETRLLTRLAELAVRPPAAASLVDDLNPINTDANVQNYNSKRSMCCFLTRSSSQQVG
ncbi:hypothetical protein BOX15_Mlig007690g1 [Macrostomum lignano]|uniref:G domain-containing protein n=1 Tax=Macrostomum lignano TaxID=282301 RepID=A0A267FV30_9PLAT|nr:hypothetical protein BOX15_Mlig007690g1 [Macrostomum lignano]